MSSLDIVLCDRCGLICETGGEAQASDPSSQWWRLPGAGAEALYHRQPFLPERVVEDVCMRCVTDVDRRIVAGIVAVVLAVRDATSGEVTE